MDRIREKIGAWLILPGHTKELLANELGISQPTLNKKLRGDGVWLWPQVIRISELTNTPLMYFAEGEYPDSSLEYYNTKPLSADVEA